MEQGAKGSQDRVKFIFDSVEIDPEVPASFFALPAKGARVSPPAPGTPTPITARSPTAAATVVPPFDSATISGLRARNVGSAAMSGRIAAVAARVEASGATTVFIGAASGGVWRSLDAGTTFKPVFDEQPAQSIGALALDPTNPRVVWAGTGEPWTRNSVSIGNGVYKSTDSGETWTRVGLEGTERITRIVVHPKDGNIVYVCAPGPLWSDSAERGLYETRDGGKTWRLILKGSNLSTGCGSLSLDPKDPSVMFASRWDFRRKGWTFRSGGEGPTAPSGSGLLRSADGGKTWAELTPEANPGFPSKPYGRIEVVVAPSDPKRVYAFVESTDSALYISKDGGKTWAAGDKSQWMVWRPFYFARLVVDPTNADRVFKMNGNLILSEDGGKSFAVVGGFNGMHGDVHDLWVDPTQPKHVIAGDDGGLWYAYDGGSKWWKAENLPISQFYHVSVDDEDPYHVYGGLQDNGTWVGDSQRPGGITNSSWESVFWGDGFWVFTDPSDPRYLYAEAQGGFLARVDKRTHEARDIQPKARRGEKLRFHWNAPLHVSPNDKRTIYLGAQFLFRSRDHGQSWERISPDLTTNDPEKQRQEESGGITVDNSAAEMHTTIYAINESPKDRSVIWVGTDDGNLQVTKNGGRSWTNVVDRVPELPPASWVNWVEASPHRAGTAYAAFDRHTFGDMGPWLYVTRDFGKTWAPLLTPAQAKDVRGYVHVVREDPVRPGLLYLGTEYGLYISIDDGARWAAYKGNRFPAVSVQDIAIHPREHDLVIGTHGRGIWIIDDISPLRSLGKSEAPVTFVKARPVQQRIAGVGGSPTGAAAFVGENPQTGAMITYYQRERHLFGRIKLEVLDPSGKVVDVLPASKRRGLNRVTWNMQVAPPVVPPAVQLAFWSTLGPRVVPGRYTVRLNKGGQVYTTQLDVGLDRRAAFSVADRKAQFAATMRVHALFGQQSALVQRIEMLRGQIAARGATTKDAAVAEALAKLDAAADAVKKQIVATKEGGAITGEERLREHTDLLYGALMSYEGRPGKYHLQRIDALAGELADIKKAFKRVLDVELPATNTLLKAKGVEAIIPPPELARLDPQYSFEKAAWLARLKRKDKKTRAEDLALPAMQRLVW
ncbi:MAG: sialidase [Deltaproteobacteria bacterium]|nr:sialidase [Deltaproteobacteria bacterium]